MQTINGTKKAEQWKAKTSAGKTNSCTFVDFPTDSSSSEDPNQPQRTKGRLSSRMLIPGNTWQTVWTAAKPVPARRQVWILHIFFEHIMINVYDFDSFLFGLCKFQRRLFDDTREAEKVLHFLETRNIGQIVQLTIVPLFHSAILRVKVNWNWNSKKMSNKSRRICFTLFDWYFFREKVKNSRPSFQTMNNKWKNSWRCAVACREKHGWH